jgi:hypothetical protein
LASLDTAAIFQLLEDIQLPAFDAAPPEVTKGVI